MFHMYCQLFYSVSNDIIIVGAINNNYNNENLKESLE